jgi:hypothetical protein
MARQADMTLVTADDLRHDVDDGGCSFDPGSSGGIGSQDYEVDPEWAFEDKPATPHEFGEAEDASIEVGRMQRCHDHRASLDSCCLIAKLRWNIPSLTLWTSDLAPKNV